jgi:hypothetical protein
MGGTLIPTVLTPIGLTDAGPIAYAGTSVLNQKTLGLSSAEPSKLGVND